MGSPIQASKESKIEGRAILRTLVFLVGLFMVVSGPLLTLLSFSSCFGTILSGQFQGCITDFAFVIFGGLLFVIGIITAIIGAVMSDSPPTSVAYPALQPVTPRPAQFTCKKCGQVFDSSRFFCPKCGQRPG